MKHSKLFIYIIIIVSAAVLFSSCSGILLGAEDEEQFSGERMASENSDVIANYESYFADEPPFPSPAASSAPSESPSTLPESGSQTTVYITKTGTKYHKSSCGMLKNGSQAIDLDTAAAKGYTPCKACH